MRHSQILRGAMSAVFAIAVGAGALAQPPAAPPGPSGETPERCAANFGGGGRGAGPGAGAAGRGGATAAAPAGRAGAQAAAPAGRGGGPGAGPGRGGARGPATPATQPRPRDDARHQCFVAQARDGDIDLLFVGDSITDWWRNEGRGLPDWNRTWAPLNAANFAIAGDTTQGVLWRMQNGELEGFEAKTIVFMLGTNNLSFGNTPADIAAGNAAIIREFRKQQPQAEVLVLGVFPRGEAPDSQYREPIRELNYHLSHIADQENVHYMDISEAFLEDDGTLPREVMPDGLHPSPLGYELWRDAIYDKVIELMG